MHTRAYMYVQMSVYVDPSRKKYAHKELATSFPSHLLTQSSNMMLYAAAWRLYC